MSIRGNFKMCEYCEECKIKAVQVSSKKEYVEMFDEDADIQYGCICPKCKKPVCSMCV